MSNHLLVPGTSGTKLLLDGKDVGWPVDIQLAAWLVGGSQLIELIRNALGATSGDEVGKLLSIEFADPASTRPTRTTLAGGNVVAGAVLNVAYNQFQSYVPFSYDWRGDVRESGASLLARLESKSPSDPKWKIVCHSQGGLVVCAAARACADKHGGSDEAFADLVSHVAFLAVPFFGTVNSADALVRGEALGDAFSPFLLPALRSWPSLYQMLPRWAGSVRVVRDEQVLPLDFTLIEDDAWESYPDVSRALLRRARATQAEFLDAPLASLKGVQIRIFMSRAQRTRGFVLKGHDRLLFPKPLEEGDTLVPFETTRATMSDFELDRVLGLGQSGSSLLEHFMLANDPVASRAVGSFFEAEGS